MQIHHDPDGTYSIVEVSAEALYDLLIIFSSGAGELQDCCEASVPGRRWADPYRRVFFHLEMWTEVFARRCLPLFEGPRLPRRPEEPPHHQHHYAAHNPIARLPLPDLPDTALTGEDDDGAEEG